MARLIYIALLLGLFNLSSGFDLLKHYEIPSAISRMLVPPSRRYKRQAFVNSNCVLKNVMQMHQNLLAAYPDQKNASADTAGFLKTISEDPDSVEKICNATLPNYQEMLQCPNDDFKTIMLTSLRMTAIMCITNYTEYKKHNPCMVKVGKLYEPTCRKQCQSNEAAYKELSTFGKNLLSIYSNERTRQIIKGSCLYAQCTMGCYLPNILAECGPEAEKLSKIGTAETFSNITVMFASLPNKMNIWPEECENIGRNLKIETMHNPVKFVKSGCGKS